MYIRIVTMGSRKGLYFERADEMDNKFEWLTEEICHEYLKRASELPPNDGQDTGAWRELRIELQKRCNLKDMEAINILHGYNIKEYVWEYDVKSGKIPMPEAMKKRLEKGKKKTLDDVIRDYEEKLADLESIKKYGFGSDYDFEEKE